MPRYNDLIENLNKKTIFCNNLGFGEQGAVLSHLKTGLFVCSNVEETEKMKLQLSALGKNCCVINEFDKPFTFSKFKSNQNKLQKLSALFNLSNDCILISTPQILFTPFCDFNYFKNKTLTFKKNDDYNIKEIEKSLTNIGYKKVEQITCAGEFAVRGDIVDVFNILDDSPTRLDFFDTELEDIYSFDFLTFEKQQKKTNFVVIPNTEILFDDEEKKEIMLQMHKLATKENLFFELYNSLELNNEIPLEFLLPFTEKINTIFNFNIPIIISGGIEFETTYNKILKSINDKIELVFADKTIQNKFKKNEIFNKIDEFYSKNCKNLIFFNNFDAKLTDIERKFKSTCNIDFKTKNFDSFINKLEKLEIALAPFKEKQIFLCLSSNETLLAIKKIFSETKIPFSLNKNAKGIVLTDLKIPYNICFEDDDKFFIGSSNFAHKKEFKLTKNQTIKYLPKPGEYVVHSTHGIGKCEGVVTVNVGGVDKEFFKLCYRGGDTLYVPYESADCLSLYLADGDNVTLNKLGGKEFATQKLKAIQSIEDMSKDLLELYAKRKSTKGFKYPEDDYLYTEFENAFAHSETADQMQAIVDVKTDMQQGKVMDRLICGDVGFGKTEVALRAVFKAVESGKQVAILAPTTILSLQHFMTASNRMKDFGVNVEMLNRFKTNKEQKQIIADLKEGKINVICGTHRLLSKDVVFKDLGLLVLDEEQRFGVKAKEQIKQLKNNIDVLTLSATPIPRTLSMSLMSIRDISIINTAPVNRLPVKTYVMAYNDEIISTAINDEINRGGQVLVVYNNVENIYKIASKLETTVNNPNAHFDVAHGQMTETALENAVKRLYDQQTNVLVSTTLIENGIDLPKANTLIVLESDKLGLSQMYQLRGRVGRNADQAYAYFTFNKNKILSEDASNRLQAIAENTELGSGFKIAMRDLQIRGAGELLGKVQHGHMVKIGYDMYTKLLNDTIKRLKGEKVDIERDVKIEIAITSKIPYSFVEDETERLKIIAKISNISSKEQARDVLNDLIAQYGKLPTEIYQLTNVALIKALSVKQGIKQVLINKNKMNIVYYNDVDVQKLMKKVNKFSHFKFENGIEPTIAVNPNDFSVQTAMNYFIEFLNA